MNKPAINSKGMWGLGIAFALQVAQLLGVDVTGIDPNSITDTLMSVGELISMGLAAYGRITAEGPITSIVMKT